MTFKVAILERVEINSSVIPSAKYSSCGFGLMFVKGRIAILFLPGASPPASFLYSTTFGLGPISQPLIPSPLSAGLDGSNRSMPSIEGRIKDAHIPS